MSAYHFHVIPIKRSKGQSAVACAVYRSGDKLFSGYYGEASDYTRKRGIIHTEILLPAHAPPEYSERQSLWNSVEKAEPHPKAQLAYSFDIALQNEFSVEENIAIARQKMILEAYVREKRFPNPRFFVDDGYSGTNYDRPGFQEMLAEIEAGNVSTYITKDSCAIIGLNQKDPKGLQV